MADGAGRGEVREPGVCYAILHSTRQGRPLYESLGWAPTSEMAIRWEYVQGPHPHADRGVVGKVRRMDGATGYPSPSMIKVMGFAFALPILRAGQLYGRGNSVIILEYPIRHIDFLLDREHRRRRQTFPCHLLSAKRRRTELFK